MLLFVSVACGALAFVMLSLTIPECFLVIPERDVAFFMVVMTHLRIHARVDVVLTFLRTIGAIRWWFYPNLAVIFLIALDNTILDWGLFARFPIPMMPVAPFFNPTCSKPMASAVVCESVLDDAEAALWSRWLWPSCLRTLTITRGCLIFRVAHSRIHALRMFAGYCRNTIFIFEFATFPVFTFFPFSKY